MKETDRDADKWNKHYLSTDATANNAANLLINNQYLLPKNGLALDLACGLGDNALWLAKSGFETQAWDLSSVACERLQQTAKEAGVVITTQERNVEQQPPEANSFDIIVVRFFLCREITSHLVKALRPGGLLFYETFTRTRVCDSGPKNPDYRLKEGELLTLFSELSPRVYREESVIGDTTLGQRNIAQLIAEKPAE